MNLCFHKFNPFSFFRNCIDNPAVAAVTRRCAAFPVGGKRLKTGNTSYIRNLNRKIILEKMIEHQSISRAELSKITGLNKATVSSQVASLLEEGLVVENTSIHSGIGRNPLLLSLNRNAGYSMGIDIDTHAVHILLTDLAGTALEECHLPVSDPSYEHVKEMLITKIRELAKGVKPSRYGLIGIGIGVHGIVDKEQRIVFTPRQKWRNVDLKSDLEAIFKVPVYVENNNNLCAYAEKVFHFDSGNLLCISTYSGIGMGIILDDAIYKGIDGFAGEVGHMIVVPDGKPCPCGNRGCWEQYASEKRFLEELCRRKGLPDVPLAEAKRWIRERDPVTLELLHEMAVYLRIDLNNIINIFNPETIVINGDLYPAYPEMIGHIQKNLTSFMNHYRSIHFSTLGKNACVLGACMMNIKNFLGVSRLKLGE